MGKIRVADGSLVDPYNIRPQDIKLDVIAHAQSQINRFTGHAKFPFSIGQHSLNLYNWCKVAMSFASGGTMVKAMPKAALTHDMSEVFFNDMSSPVKRENPQYKRAEHWAGVQISEHLGVRMSDLALFDTFDKSMYKNERNALFPIINDTGMGDDLQPLDERFFMPGAFYEVHWTTIRSSLWSVYQLEFPDHVPEIPFWERPEYHGR